MLISIFVGEIILEEVKSSETSEYNFWDSAQIVLTV
jgi:hypothetical protein